MKKIIAAGLLMFGLSQAKAAVTPVQGSSFTYVQISTALQPNTTGPAGINVASGTIKTMSLVDLKSTGTWTLGGITLNGTVTDNATHTITGLHNFRSGLFVSTGPTQSAMLAVGSSSVSVRGITDASDAESGKWGEYRSSVTTSQAGVAATGAYGDLMALTLTAGDWDLTASVQYDANGATVVNQQYRVGISVTSGNSSSGLSPGDNLIVYELDNLTAGANDAVSLCVTNYRVNISATTTYYMKGYVVYSAGAPKYRGRFSARRVAH